MFRKGTAAGVWRWFDKIADVDPSFWMERVLSHPRPSPFLTPAFLQPWARCFARSLRLGIWQDRELVLFHGESESLELLGGQEVADRLDVLGESAEFLEALREQGRAWKEPLSFPNLAQDAWVFRGRRPEDVVEVTDQSPWVSLEGGFEAYLSRLTPKQRHELQRKLRRAERLARRNLHMTRGLGDLEVFLRLHRLSSPDKAQFMQEAMEDFFRVLCASLEAAGMLWLRTLWDGPQALASLLHIRFDNRLHLYNSGFDPERAELAPGLVLMGWSLREAAREGLREYDFLRGGERYKYQLGGQDRAVYRMVWNP